MSDPDTVILGDKKIVRIRSNRFVVRCVRCNRGGLIQYELVEHAVEFARKNKPCRCKRP